MTYVIFKCQLLIINRVSYLKTAAGSNLVIFRIPKRQPMTAMKIVTPINE